MRYERSVVWRSGSGAGQDGMRPNHQRVRSSDIFGKSDVEHSEGYREGGTSEGYREVGTCETLSPADHRHSSTKTHVQYLGEERTLSWTYSAVSASPVEGNTEVGVRSTESQREQLILAMTALLNRSLCPQSPSIAPPMPVRAVESVFSAVSRQSFSLEFYVRRLVTHLDVSLSVFPLALSYLRRLEHAPLEFRVIANELNVHRLLITATLIAIKFTEDTPICMSYVAKVGGIQTVAEMIRLESSMLMLLKYQCFPREEELWYTEAALENERSPN